MFTCVFLVYILSVHGFTDYLENCTISCSQNQHNAIPKGEHNKHNALGAPTCTKLKVVLSFNCVVYVQEPQQYG